MSKLITQLADVLAEIALQSRKAAGWESVPDLRRAAISTVAARHRVHPNTVADAFIRRLRPEIVAAVAHAAQHGLSPSVA